MRKRLEQIKMAGRPPIPQQPAAKSDTNAIAEQDERDTRTEDAERTLRVPSFLAARRRKSRRRKRARLRESPRAPRISGCPPPACCAWLSAAKKSRKTN